MNKFIMIADWVPLKNKGEEAILRGFEDMYGLRYSGTDVQIGLFDLVDTYQVKGNLHIFPLKWVYPYYETRIYRNFNVRKIFLIIKTMLNSAGIHHYGKNILSDKYPELVGFVTKSEVVFVGHDGSFSPFGAGVLRVLQSNGLKTAMLGAGFTPNRVLKPFIKKFWRKLFLKCEFITLREKRTFEYVKRLVPEKEHVYLAPDPAFFFDEEDIVPEAFLKIKASIHTKPLVGVTVCENSIVFKEAFTDKSLSFSAKQEHHAKYIAKILDALSDRFECHYIFLPHCIEEGLGDDIRVSNNVCNYMKKRDFTVMHMDFSVREMKKILSELDFVIGERTHSIINSISIGTPFIAITNTKDFRTQDIVKDMCELDYIINIDKEDFDGHIEKIFSTFEHSKENKGKIDKVSVKMKNQLRQIATQLL